MVLAAGNRSDGMLDLGRWHGSGSRLRVCAILLPVAALLVQGAQDVSYFGLDWGGLCVTSTRQSPINLVPAQFLAAPNASSPNLNFDFGTGTNVTVRAASPCLGPCALLVDLCRVCAETIHSSNLTQLKPVMIM